nr:MAG TPA: hypothetical protein [Caudoviricetes sp.]
MNFVKKSLKLYISGCPTYEKKICVSFAHNRL